MSPFSLVLHWQGQIGLLLLFGVWVVFVLLFGCVLCCFLLSFSLLFLCSGTTRILSVVPKYGSLSWHCKKRDYPSSTKKKNTSFRQFLRLEKLMRALQLELASLSLQLSSVCFTRRFDHSFSFWFVSSVSMVLLSCLPTAPLVTSANSMALSAPFFLPSCPVRPQKLLVCF